MRPGSHHRLVLAIALVSAAALAYQLLLMRWLAIAHWHPFAVMIISLALLGHGASGTWLGLWLDQAKQRFDWLFPAAALLFAASALIVLDLARHVDFNGLELVWNPRQLVSLGALYLLLSLPFFFAASCFGLAFARFGDRIPGLYGADLLGAGAGAVLAMMLLPVPVERAVVMAATLGALAAAVTAPRRKLAFGVAFLLVGALLAFAFATRALIPPVNQFKGLAKALLLPDARVVAQRDGPYGWLAVVESPQVPLRHVPGLSLAYTREPPPQLALFTDGDALSIITRNSGHAGNLGYLHQMTSTLPYLLVREPRVLVLGAGGGQDVLQALELGARHVDAVELDPQRLRLVGETFAGYAGHLYGDPRVRTIAAEPRAFARSTNDRYDLVVLAGSDSFAGGGAGVRAASEQYALTVDALRDYLRVLAPGGMVAVTRYSKQPPRDELKLWATAVEALRTEGVQDPERHLLALRSWDSSTSLLSRAPLPAGSIAKTREFARANSFDPVHYPGMRASEANRYNVVEHPYLYEGTRHLLSPGARRFIDAYKFDIAPATDDRPYFGNFFRWHSLPELWNLREQGAAVLLDSGYLLLVAALVQAIPLAIVLVVLPLLARRPVRIDGIQTTDGRMQVACYFVALGLAFLVIEIATLSRLTLLVGHPLLAATVGLAGFLAFAGAGSMFAQRLFVRVAEKDDGEMASAVSHWVTRAVVVIALGIAWQMAVFTATFHLGAQWSVGVRALVGLLGIAPLAFAMGLPFPLGLARLSRTRPEFVPWAWGLNGCASVIAAIAALLLAMAVGLRASLLLALALYAFAAWIWRAQYRSTGSTSSDQRTRRASGSA